MVRVNYNVEHFCHHCSVKVALEIFRCPDCHQKVRTKAHNKSKTYAQIKKYLNYKTRDQNNQNRDEDFRVKMRRLRVQRMLSGLKPNVPIPEVE